MMFAAAVQSAAVMEMDDLGGESWVRAQNVLHRRIDAVLPAIDDNEDGEMSLEELYRHLGEVMRLRHEGFAENGLLRFHEADVDGSGDLSRREYMEAALQEATEAQHGWAVTGDEHARALDKLASHTFGALDKDGNERLSAAEAAHQTGIDADIMEMLHVADKNGDMKLSREEMLASVGRIPAHLELFLAHCAPEGADEL